VELYKPGFDCFGYGRDLKVSVDINSVYFAQLRHHVIIIINYVILSI
jgi:hypothetical protein